MQTLATFLESLIVSGAVVYVTYCLMRLTAYCVCWSIERLSFKAANIGTLHGPVSPHYRGQNASHPPSFSRFKM